MSWIIENFALEEGSGLFVPFCFFDGHVLELTGLEDLSAENAFHKLGVLFA
jgi:prepilin-type processing-associated H-X9-DG protein